MVDQGVDLPVVEGWEVGTEAVGLVVGATGEAIPAASVVEVVPEAQRVEVGDVLVVCLAVGSRDAADTWLGMMEEVLSLVALLAGTSVEVMVMAAVATLAIEDWRVLCE